MKKLMFMLCLCAGFQNVVFACEDSPAFENLGSHARPSIGRFYAMGEHCVTPEDLNNKHITAGGVTFTLADKAAEKLAEHYVDLKTVTYTFNGCFPVPSQSGDTLKIYAKILETTNCRLKIITELYKESNVVFSAEFQFVNVEMTEIDGRIKPVCKDLPIGLQHQKPQSLL